MLRAIFNTPPYMKLHMRYHLAGTVTRLNVEHRTPNIERRILMTLRFIDFIISEPQNTDSLPATSPSVVSLGSNDSV